MKATLTLLALFALAPLANAQGAPSPEGQSVTPQAASSAERAVELRHEKVIERSKAKTAQRAASAASAVSK